MLKVKRLVEREGLEQALIQYAQAIFRSVLG